MMKELNHLDESSGSVTAPNVFQLMLNNITESFILADENMAVIDSNKAARQGIWNHFAVELIPGFSLLNLAEHSLRPFLKDLYADVLNGNQRKIEHITDDLNGQKQFFEINVIPARNESNEMEGVIIYAKNVTEKKKKHDPSLLCLLTRTHTLSVLSPHSLILTLTLSLITSTLT